MTTGEKRGGAFQALGWTFLDQFAGRGVSFVVQLILARLLMPADFAQVAMIFIFIGIGEILSDSGMTASLIRIKNPTQEDYSSVFYVNIFIALLVYLLIYILAPFVANFYKDSQLIFLLRIYGISIIIKSLSGVQSVILVKQLNFKRQFFIQLPSVIIGGIVGIYCAYAKMGAVSIVYMYLVQNAVSTIQYWVIEKWYPQIKINWQKLKMHFKFGYKLSAAYMINQVFEDSYNVYIGKFYSADLLGYYNRANAYTNLPAFVLTRSLSKVTYPLFSHYNDDADKLRKLYREITVIVMFAFSFFSAFLFFQAENLFKIFLGDKWLGAVLIFKIQVIATLLYPLSSYNGNVIRAKGRSDLILKAMLFYRILTVAGFIICLGKSIYLLLYWQIFTVVIYTILFSILVDRQIGYKFSKQVLDIIKLILLSFAIAYLTNWVLVIILSKMHSPMVNLASFVILYSALFLGVNYFIRSEAMSLFYNLVLKRFFKYLPVKS